MDFLIGILQYFVKYVLMIGVALSGVFLGKTLRAKKDAKKLKSE